MRQEHSLHQVLGTESVPWLPGKADSHGATDSAGSAEWLAIIIDMQGQMNQTALPSRTKLVRRNSYG